MRPANLKTKIFLDSGDPEETREAINLLGFLDGQTTNPSLIAKNPETIGKKFTKQEIFDFYHQVVQEISELIPEGSVSIEVYADASTKAEAMLRQAKEFYSWISPTPSQSPPQAGGEKGEAHIKFPTTPEGLKAAEIAVKEKMRVNMTLCFSQEQAAAVHAATKGAGKGQVFVSPFVGRLDDRGENGMDLIKNIIKMYRGDLSSNSSPSPGEEGRRGSHVEVLTASVRSLDHFMYALELGSDIITSPLKIIKEYSVNNQQFLEYKTNLKPIEYKQLDLNKPWQELYKPHELTEIGIQKFSEDWNKLIEL